MTVAVQPSFSTATASVTPSGIWNFMLVVGDPSHPCSTLNATVADVPAWIAIGIRIDVRRRDPSAQQNDRCRASGCDEGMFEEGVLIAVVVAR